MTGVMASARGGSFVPTQGWAGTKSGVALAKVLQARTRVCACPPWPTSRVRANPLASSTAMALEAAVKVPRPTARAGTQKLKPAAGTDAGIVATKDSARSEERRVGKECACP